MNLDNLFWKPLMWHGFTQLTNVSEIKFFCSLDDGKIINGLRSNFEHGAFLSVWWEGVGELKLESPIHKQITAAEPLAQLFSFFATWVKQ